MKLFTWLVLAQLVVASPCMAQDSQDQEQPQTLDQVKQAYEKQMAQTEADYTDGVAKLITLYKAGLIKLKKTLQTAGDFDGVVAVDTEYKRCDDQWDGAMTDGDVVETPAKMKALQKQYLSRYTAISRDKNKTIIDLSEKYKVSLFSMRAALIKSDQIDAAKKVNDEIDAVTADARVTDAQSQLDVSRQKTKSDAAPVAAPPPTAAAATNTTTSATNRVLSQDVTVTVADKDPPTKNGIHFTKMRMLSAMKANLKARLLVDASLGEKAATDSSGDSYYTTKNIRRDSYIRLQLKQSQVGQTTKNAVVVVQVFTRDEANGGRANPTENAVKIIVVPEIGSTPVWLDLPHMRTNERRDTRKWVSSGQPQTTASGSAFYGIAVTVFVDNAIVVQQVSVTSLKNEVVTNIPDAPKPDPRGTRYYYFVNQQDETPL